MTEAEYKRLHAFSVKAEMENFAVKREMRALRELIAGMPRERDLYRGMLNAGIGAGAVIGQAGYMSNALYTSEHAQKAALEQSVRRFL